MTACTRCRVEPAASAGGKREIPILVGNKRSTCQSAKYGWHVRDFLSKAQQGVRIVPSLKMDKMLRHSQVQQWTSNFPFGAKALSISLPLLVSWEMPPVFQFNSLAQHSDGALWVCDSLPNRALSSDVVNRYPQLSEPRV